MALTPWNRQEEWYQQMINASTGNYLPSISAQDAGKVMTVESDGSWGVENVPQELPAVETTDKDKYLHTNASTGAVEWSAVEDELPAVTSSDKDKYLHTNDSTGALEWAEGGSGGGVLVVTSDFETGTLDKTWQEIHDAMLSGGAVVKFSDTNVSYVTRVAYNFMSSTYVILVGAERTYKASAASGYPTLDE